MAQENRRRRRIIEQTDDDQDDAELEPRRAVRPRAPRRRWPLRLGLFLVAIGTLVYFAPKIAVWGPVRERVVTYAIPEFAGRISTGSLSIGWFSPIEIQKLEVLDADKKKPLAQVTSITSQNTLFGLVLNPKRLGTFRLEQPQLHLVLREDGSNLEDALEPFLKGEKKEGGRVDIGLEVVDGHVDIHDTTTGESWQVEQITALIHAPRDPAKPLDAKIKCLWKPANEVGGELAAELAWNAPQNTTDSSLGTGTATLETKSLPLSALDPILRRFVGNYDLAGTATTLAKFEWQNNDQEPGSTAHSLQIDELQFENLRLTAPELLGRDALQLDRLGAKGGVSLRNGRCTLQHAQLESDVARLNVDGTVLLDALLANKSAMGALSVLQNEDLQLAGHLDLAKLAQLLPGTMHVREGTQIQSGDISVSVVSRLDGTVRHWDAKLDSSNLTAVDGGRQITWEKPVHVSLAAYQSDNGPIVERLFCESSFLQADARGTLAKGDIRIQGDLNQLATELDPFFDLGMLKLAGKLDGGLKWEQGNRDAVVAQGQLVLSNFEMNSGLSRKWRQQQLTIQLAASGTLDGTSLSRLDTATVDLKSGTDDLRVELAQPVNSPSAQSTWLVRNRMAGDLETWLARIHLFAPLHGWEMAGTIDLNNTVSISPTHVYVSNGKLQCEQLRVAGPHVFLDEPVVKAEITDAAFEKSGHVTAKLLTAQSSAVAIRADNIDFQSGEKGLNVGAAIGFRGDIERLMSWLHDPRAPLTQQFSGEALGQVQFAFDAGVTQAQWDVTVKNFGYATLAQPTEGNRTVSRGQPAGSSSPLKTVWTEPELKLNGNGSYAVSKDEFRLQSFAVSSNSLQVAAKGSVTDPANRCLLDLEGTIGYDLQHVAQLLRPYLGDSVAMEGRDNQPFAIRGPVRNATLRTQDQPQSRLTSLPNRQRTAADEQFLWPPADLAGNAKLGWTTATAYGLQFGPGNLHANLANRLLRVDPVDLSVGDGRLTFAPQIYLDREPAILAVERGPLLEQVHISPEMCAVWLKYVMPLMAEVTEVQGTFSVHLTDTAVIPVGDPLAGESKGDFAVHKLLVGPGPLAQQFLSMAQTVKSLFQQAPATPSDPNARSNWVTLPEQRVPFHWKDHRVYHQGLTMTINDVVIRTQGSVGMDQSLDMVAEIPVRDEWLAKGGTLGSSLKGQVLKIPVGGTLTRPQVDRSAFTQITRDAVKGAAGRAVEDQLNKGVEKGFQSLDRFLKPRNP